LFAGYHQCPIAETVKEKTAFIVPEGLNQFKRLPFGFQNAPSYFSRVINTAMAGLTFNSVLVYLDDLVIPGLDHSDHLVKLEKFFKD